MASQLVTIATYSTPEMAHLAKNQLEDAKITTHLADEMVVGTDWELGNTAVGGIKLQVAAHDEDRARKILAVGRLPRHRGKRETESINPIRWFWWKASWGRPSIIVVIGAWLWHGPQAFCVVLAIYQVFIINSGFRGLGDYLAGAAIVLLVGGYGVFCMTAALRATYYYRVKGRRSG
jgi:hypothetical protein